MGPFLEGKQGIIPRNKLVSRKVFTPKSVDLFFLEDIDVKAFVFLYLLVLQISTLCTS